MPPYNPYFTVFQDLSPNPLWLSTLKSVVKLPVSSPLKKNDFFSILNSTSSPLLWKATLQDLYDNS